MKRGYVFSLIVILLSSGCAGKKGGNGAELAAAVAGKQPLLESAHLSVEEIGRLKSRIRLPLRLAVAPPIITHGRRFGGRESAMWNGDETREIESWAKPLKRAGIVSDLIILPAFLLKECRDSDPACIRTASRSAAALAKADALLMISLASAVDKYTNQASLLDVTIVGLWLIPGHHRDALTIAEGMMIDTGNEYLYAIARGEAEEKMIRPFMYADSWKAVRPSRLRALQAFGRDFIRGAEQLKRK